MGGATGLDYPAVESVMRMHRIRDRRDCLSRVQVIEHEVLNVWNERSKERTARSKRGA